MTVVERCGIYAFSVDCEEKLRGQVIRPMTGFTDDLPFHFHFDQNEVITMNNIITPPFLLECLGFHHT